MNRLLIVDDEPYTVDGLYELIDAEMPGLELFRAYTAIEAIERLSRTKIDVVLTDIRMPGMDGLQLLKEIRSRWPRCKVVFLTGMTEIGYAQRAMREGGVDYILKTEGDEPILRSIRIALDAMAEELRNEQYMRDARHRFRQALPSLRGVAFRRLLLYGAEESGLSPARWRELECPLDPDFPVLPALTRIDRWPEGTTVTDKTLLTFAIENMLCELLAGAKLQVVQMDEYYFMLLVQPETAIPDSSEAFGRFVAGALEAAQEAVADLLRLPLSIIHNQSVLAWRDLQGAYERMRRKLVLGPGGGELMQLQAKEAESCCYRPMHSRQGILKERLETALENGNATVAVEAIETLIPRDTEYAQYVEAYYMVAHLMVSLANRFRLQEWQMDGKLLETLMDLKGHPGREQAISCLRDAARKLVACKRSVQEERRDHIVDRIDRYIHDNLGGDLSLTALAEMVYLNPTYLSTLYKQMTGRNLSDTITAARMEKAKELLRESAYKVHELAAAVGFENAGYFARFFRKNAGMGPQEYRDLEQSRTYSPLTIVGYESWL